MSPPSADTTSSDLVVGWVPVFHRGIVSQFRYSYQTIANLTFWTLSFYENEGNEFTQLFNRPMISEQSIVTVRIPNGQEFYLTGGFVERPFIAGVFGDLVVVQVCEKVYCLSISRDLEIEHTFTLSKPLGIYHSATSNGDFLNIYYYPADNIPENPDGVYGIPDKEVFHLV